MVMHRIGQENKMNQKYTHPDIAIADYRDAEIENPVLVQPTTRKQDNFYQIPDSTIKAVREATKDGGLDFLAGLPGPF